MFVLHLKCEQLLQLKNPCVWCGAQFADRMHGTSTAFQDLGLVEGEWQSQTKSRPSSTHGCLMTQRCKHGSTHARQLR